MEQRILFVLLADSLRIMQPVPPFIVADLLKRCMGNAQFMQRTLAKFQSRAGDDVERLHHSIASGDAVEATRLAHSIKGIAANLSATGMMNVADEIERLSRASCVADALPLMASLRTEVDRCVAFVPIVITSLEPLAPPLEGDASQVQRTPAVSLSEASCGR